jgi:hypothetical protein
MDGRPIKMTKDDKISPSEFFVVIFSPCPPPEKCEIITTKEKLKRKFIIWNVMSHAFHNPHCLGI